MTVPTYTIAMSLLLAALSTSTRAATNRFGVTASSSVNYTMNSQPDPDFTLVRGMSYVFNISVAGVHPFYIKTAQITGSGSQYNDGVSAQGVTSGSIVFNVPINAPDTLHYQCGTHFNMHGLLNIIDLPEVLITDFSVGTNLVIQSTGTDSLNLNVRIGTNLASNAIWSPMVIQSNNFTDGTNTTHIALPATDSAFFQVQQGFF